MTYSVYRRSFIVLFLIALPAMISCTSDPLETRDRHMKRGDSYFEKGEFKSSIIEYLNAVQADPKFSQGHYRLALAYLKTEQPEKAFAELSRTVDLDPSNLDAQLKLGQIYALAGSTTEATGIADLVLKQNPENIDGLFLKVAVLIQEQTFNEAIAVLKQIVNLDERNAKAYILLGRLNASQGKFSEASEFLKRAVTVKPTDPNARMELARFHERQGELSKAEQEMREALALNKQNVTLLNSLGDFYHRNGNLKKAETVYLEMTELEPNSVEPKLKIGAFYISQRDWEKALHFMRRAQELQPKNTEIESTLAALYLDMGESEQAQRLIESLLYKDERSKTGRLLKAQLLLKSNRPEDAAELLDSTVKDYPSYADAHYYLGLAYTAMNDYLRAKRSLLEAVSLDSNNLKARTLLARIYLGEGAVDLALEHLEKVIVKEPRNDQARLLTGDAFLLKKNLEEARLAYLQVVDTSPGDTAAYYRLARLHRMELRYEQAMENVDRVLNLQTDHLPAIWEKSSIYVEQNQPNEALSFLDRKIHELGEDSKLAAALHEMRGKILASQNNYEQSQAAFERALQLNPDLIEPHISLAELYQNRREIHKAISHYETVIRKQPELTRIYIQLGLLYEAEVKGAEARAMYEKALEIDPNFAPAANNLAYLLAQTGEDPDRALYLAKKAKAQLPDNPDVADTLGLTLLAKGLYPSAIAELNDAAQKMSQYPTVFYHLGLAHWKSGDNEKALEALSKALDMNQDFPEKEKTRNLLRVIEEEKEG